MSGKVLGGVLVAVQDVEVVSVDLDVAANWHFCRRNELHLLVDILVLSSL